MTLQDLNFRNCLSINYSPVQFHEKKEVINGDYTRNILADRFCEKERTDMRVNSTHCEKGFGLKRLLFFSCLRGGL